MEQAFWEGRIAAWILIVAAAVWGLHQLRGAALVLLASLLVAVVLAPVAEGASRLAGGRRAVGALSAVAVLLGVVVLGTASVGPPLAREISRLLVALPDYLRLAARELERLEAQWMPNALGCVAVLLGIRAVIDVLISPLVLRNLLRLHPVVILASILVGADLFGLVGVFLAAPVATTVAMMLRASDGRIPDEAS